MAAPYLHTDAHDERYDHANLISWNAARPLSWDDFQGPVREGAPPRFAAETNCGISISTNRVHAAEPVQVSVANHFDKRSSWVRPEQRKDDVLRHEQGHWDICELYTRIMRERFEAAHITGTNLKTEVQRIYNEVTQEYLRRQQQYEEETQHGTVASEQARWDSQIAADLTASSSKSLN